MNENEKQKQKVLIDNIYDFLQRNKDEELELKPTEYYNSDDDFSLFNKEVDLEEYKKDYSTEIDKEIYIIAQNINDDLFNLNDQKYLAIISRIDVWGFDLTMEQFILSYYLYIKKDNKLRQFVINHMDKIIKAVKLIMDNRLVKGIKRFEFRNNRNKLNIEKLKKQREQNDQKLKKVKIKEEEEEQQKQKEEQQKQTNITTNEQEEKIQNQILEKLKQQHAILQKEI